MISRWRLVRRRRLNRESVRNSQNWIPISLGRSQLKRIILGLMFTYSASAATAEIDCQAIVAATLDELALGATSEWTAMNADLARSAAGSACLKAASGRYGEDASLESVGVSSESQRTATSSGKAEDSQGEPEGEESGGLKFKPMTGSPTQKPYERARSVDN